VTNRAVGSAVGVETANEPQVLEEFGVAMAQGYRLGRPEPQLVRSTA
jgi:EAL domain-containing protein (putative c-di-GMP-specific phosphodiesterase class I)